MTSTTTLAPTGPARLIGFRINEHNAPVYRVTPLADGMEHVEHVVNAAHPYVYERAEDGFTKPRLIHPDELGLDPAAIDWAGGYADHLRIKTGTHRAVVTLSPEQAALRERYGKQTGTPAEGDRWVVATMSGYQLVQNRDLDHRHCHCGDGTTTYAEGTVVRVIHWADNSRDVEVALDEGGTRTVQTVAPHGDACF